MQPKIQSPQTPAPQTPAPPTPAPQIRTRRWNDPQQPGDGERILITRYRPRGLAKVDETWDRWITALAPSAALLATFKGKNGPGLQWSTYRAGYLREMREQKPLIAQLAKRVANGETITLLCASSCVREDRCHRSLLKALIEAEMKRLPP